MSSPSRRPVPKASQPPILSPDIFRQIALHLSPSDSAQDLAACMQVSHDFHKIVSSILYRRIHLAPNFRCDPLLDLTPHNVSSRKQASLERVRELVIGHHFPMWCNRHPILDLPQLQVLRLNHGNINRVCLVHYPMGDGKQCGLISHARPKKLVVANVSPYQLTCPIDNSTINMSTSAFLEGIQEYVCLMEPPLRATCISVGYSETPCGSPLLTNIPPNAGRVTIVFWTPAPTIQWKYQFPLSWVGQGQIPPGLRSSSGPLNGTWVGDIAARLAEIPLGSTRELYVINAGGIYGPVVGEEWWARETIKAKVEAELRGCLESKLDGTAELEEVQGRVKFATMEEYMGMEASAGVFDETEMAPWRTAGQ